MLVYLRDGVSGETDDSEEEGDKSEDDDEGDKLMVMMKE